jgi:hypothetical protein
MIAALEGMGGTMASGLFKLSVAGTSFTTAQTCPRADAPSAVGYTAAGNELTLMDGDNILTFTLR